MNLDRKTAKEHFTISKHKDTYEITGFFGVGYRQGTWGKGSGYEYYFYDDKTSREITIPEEIDGLPVTKVAVKCLPEDAVVFCRGELFAKLTRGTKASTARAYLEDPSRFVEDEAEQIKKFLKKYSEDAAAALCGSECAEAYARFLSLASVKPESIERMLAAAEGNAEVKAVLLGGGKKKPKVDAMNLNAPKKLTAAEFKKLWTYSEYTIEGGEEKFIELRNYKGSDSHVVIPAMLGKKRIRKVSTDFPALVTSVEFEDPDLELACSFRNCKGMADENGFIVIPLGIRSVLTDYIGPKDAETITVPEGVTENTNGTFRKMNMREVIFPAGFEKLAFGTFSGCERLQRVALPDGLKEIGSLAFSDCVSLQKLYIPASVEAVELGTAIDFYSRHTEIYGEPGSAAQASAEKRGFVFHAGSIPDEPLPDYVIRDGTLIRYFGSDADVHIPAGVTEIYLEAFTGNDAVRTITVPEGVERLRVQGCRNLQAVTLPGTLRRLGAYAFSECPSLTSITIPTSVTEIEGNAFTFCHALAEIHISAETISIGEKAFSFCANNLTIHAPAGSYAEQYAKENNIPFVAE